MVLTGISQRRAQGITFGANYVVAPGFTVFAEYMYEEIYQGGNNFVTGAVCTAPGANAEQQRQDPGLPDRQRNQLLRPQVFGPGKAAGNVPAAFFLYCRPAAHQALATRAGTTNGIRLFSVMLRTDGPC